jgi:hypothetical protein
MDTIPVSVVWAKDQEARVYSSGNDPLTYPTESVVARFGKFTLRFDAGASTTLAYLEQRFHRPAAAVIRQLIAQATPEDFPLGWRIAADEIAHNMLGQVMMVSRGGTRHDVAPRAPRAWLPRSAASTVTRKVKVTGSDEYSGAS